MTDLGKDVRYAARMLRQSPGFVATALLTIALAVGTVTAIFTIVNAVLLRALPYSEPDRLVRLYSVDPTEPAERQTLSLPDLDDWQTRTDAFSASAAYMILPQVLLGRGDPQELRAAYVTEHFFGVLGAKISLGRPLVEDDGRGANRNAVISNRLWRSAFGGDPAVIGTTLSLQGAPFTIVGVAGPELRFPAPDVSLWLPQSVLSDRAIGPRTRENRDFAVIARLRPGVTAETAAAQTRAAASQLAREYPATNERWSGADVVPLLADLVGNVERALILVLGVVAFIALIACANVVNMLLARNAARAHEFATRRALGASSLRIVRQLLSESCLLSLLGGALGVGVAWIVVRIVLVLNADSLPRVEDVSIDRSVLIFALVVSVAVGIACGWLPAWRIARSDVRRHLKTTRGMTSAGHRVRNALVTAEVGLAIVLVVGAALMSRSFLTLSNVESGFDPEHVLAVTLQVNVGAMPAGTRVPAYLLQRRHEITERIAALPGVDYAATTSRLPLRDGASAFTFRRVNGGETERERLTANAHNVSHDYFAAMGIPLLRGTVPAKDAPIEFGTGRDRFDGQRPIVVSASAAQRFWPDEDAIGKVIDGGWFQAVVVGVVGDIRQVGLAEPPAPTLYFADGPQINATVVIRAAGDPLLLAHSIREAIGTLDPNQSIRSIVTLRDVMAASIASDRFFTFLYVAFGTLALTLAAVGVYGVVAYSVGLRRQEIGVRAAVGARPADIVRGIVGRGMRPVLAGISLGSLAALLLARTIEHQLYGVGATDPVSFLAAPAVLAVVAVLACYVPARAATRIDPVTALRSE